MKKGTTKSLGNKEANDKFYTKREVAEELVKLLPTDFDIVIEPSAGSGNFSDALKKIFPKILSYDLMPEREDITEQDWLTLDKRQFDGKKVLVAGNPPFGTGGNLALQFIKEAKFADTVAFILPKSFKKETLKDRVPREFHCVLEKDLEPNSFTLNGQNYSVPTVFQIWQKSDTLRLVSKKVRTSKLFEFTTKEEADFRVQRVGGSAGKASLDLDYSTSSNYFLKNLSKFSNQEFVEFILGLEFPSINDVVGPRSLSKHELITVIEKNYQKGAGRQRVR